MYPLAPRAAAEYANLSHLVQCCKMLRELVDAPSQQHQLDELLGTPASAEVVVKMLTNVCLPALVSMGEGGVVGSRQLLQQ